MAPCYQIRPESRMLSGPRLGAQYRWQDTCCSAATVLSRGVTLEHSGIAEGHRGWNAHPAGGSIGDGTSPLSTISSRGASGSAGSAAENSAFVYGCSGFRYRASVAAYSTIRPRYMTAVRCAM